MPSSRNTKWDGSKWAPNMSVKKWGGTTFVDAAVVSWDGDSWSPVVDRTPNTTARVSSWNSSWVGTYNGSGSRIRTDAGYQGQFSSNNGNQKAMFGFPFANIRAALAGSTISLVQLKATVVHAYYFAGVNFQFGTNNFTGSTPPAGYVGPVSRALSTKLLPEGTREKLTVPNTFAVQIRDGLAAGISLDTLNTSHNYYGAISALTLTVHYTK